MRSALGAFGLAASIAGCATASLSSPAPHRGGAVELSSREPEPGCSLLGALELRAPAGGRTTPELLGAWAAERGGNYVVLDAFSVVAEPDVELITRARLFSCPAPRVAVAR